MKAPHWLIGLGRLTWYVGLAPLAFLHLVLVAIGGGKWAPWLEESPQLILALFGLSAAWAMAAARLLGALP